MKRNKLAILNMIVGVILVSIIFYQQHELKEARKIIVDYSMESSCYILHNMQATDNGDGTITIPDNTECTKTGNDLAKAE
jgi:hypothetical protein